MKQIFYFSSRLKDRYMLYYNYHMRFLNSFVVREIWDDFDAMIVNLVAEVRFRLARDVHKDIIRTTDSFLYHLIL